MATTTSSTSGSVLQALGLGSGLDIQNLVSTLTEAEMNAANKRVERQQESVTAQVSGMASLKSSLSVFQASLLSLTTGQTFSPRSATSSHEDMLTVTADSDAVVGNYRVEIEQLATSQQLLSDSFTGGRTAVVGTGELTLSVGGDSFTVTIDSTNSTLADIRDAINDSEDNSGVSAALIYGTNGEAQLLLSSNETGAGHDITVSATGGDGGLSVLTYGPSDTANYTEDQSSQDAIVYVAGVKHTSSSNTVSDAVDGITLNLLEADLGTEITVQVANNSTNMVSLVETFVTAYNTLNEQMSSLGKYDAATQTAGSLLGDAIYNNVQRQLSHALRDQVAGLGSVYNSLSALGVTTTASGSLTLDEDKLNAALSADYEAVAETLQAENGLISRLNSFLDEALSSGGLIAARDASLDREQEQIDDLKDWVEMRTAQVEARYLAKFNAMDSLLAQLNSTSEYLTQTFDALTKDSD